MEQRQTAICFEKLKTSTQNCGKQTNPATKKRKRNNDTSNAASSSNVDVNKNRKVNRMPCTIDDLPAEMLEAILHNVASSYLINCRQVNRKWHGISSRIMRQRADIQIVFALKGGRLMRNILQYTRDSLTGSSTSLNDLIGCLEQSKHFPYSNFRFRYLGTDDRDVFERFLSVWGENIYELAVKIDDEVHNTEMLRVLLLEKTPNVKRLGIEFTFDWKRDRKFPIHLFADSNKFQLPNLHVLQVYSVFQRYAGIVEDILEAAPNLKRFEKSSLDNGRVMESITAKELTILQSMDKLHCIEKIYLMFDADMIKCLQNSPQIMDARFKSIELAPDWLQHCDHHLSTLATQFLNKMFDSSRDSLQMLAIPPLGEISGLVLPKFENLRKLTMSHNVEQMDEDGVVYCMFAPRFDMTYSFPNLQELTAFFYGEDEYFSALEPKNVMPKVEFLRIVNDDQYDEKLMQMTPNCKTLLVSNDSEWPPSMNFHEIATCLPKLENLGWEIYGKSQRDLQSRCELDSLITGYSKTFCKVKSVEFRDKKYLSQQEVASYEPYRRYDSLVDLKELKRFDMSVNLTNDSYKKCDCEEYDCGCDSDEDDDDDDDENCDNAGFNRYSDWYQSSLTKVAQFLAFDLMPDLETNIKFTFN